MYCDGSMAYCIYCGCGNYLVEDSDGEYSLVHGMEYADIYMSYDEAVKVNEKLCANGKVSRYFSRRSKEICA